MPVRIKKLSGLLYAILLVFGSGEIIAQEHSYAPADIENGKGLYQANCLGCHGNEGDGVDGANLSTGRFRYASSDEDLIRLIRAGIPNTPMPPHNGLSVGQVRTVVAFLRALPTGAGRNLVDEREVRVGDAGRGELVFQGNAECGTCHGVNGGGNLLSPDLGNIGALRSPGSIEQSILEPNAEVRSGNRFYQLVDNDGNTVLGKLLNQDTHSVQLMNSDEKLVAYNKSEISDYGFNTSAMPSYLDILSSDDVADLLAYLLTLTDGNSP